MKSLVLLVLCFVSVASFASEKFKFSFNNEELSKMIETYAKETGQKFVIDPGVRGKATILLPDSVTAEEAFNQLSSALALNGYAISKQDDTMIVMSSRNIQRNMIETYVDQVPSLKPVRMVTYITTLKTVSANEVNRDMRIFPSKDGEMSVLSSGNQLIISDWTSNIQRIAATLKELDKPVPADIAKLVAAEEKKQKERRKEMNEMQKKTGSNQPPPPPPHFKKDDKQ